MGQADKKIYLFFGKCMCVCIYLVCILSLYEKYYTCVIGQTGLVQVHSNDLLKDSKVGKFEKISSNNCHKWCPMTRVFFSRPTYYSIHYYKQALIKTENWWWEKWICRLEQISFSSLATYTGLRRLNWISLKAELINKTEHFENHLDRNIWDVTTFLHWYYMLCYAAAVNN